MQADDPDWITAPAEQGHRYERLEPLLLELGHVVEARVFQRIFADEGRLTLLERPPREPLAAGQDDLADEVSVRLRRCVEIETLPVAVEEVDEACVDRARVREQPHDGVEHLLEVERRGDRRDDRGEKTLPDARQVVGRGYVANFTWDV